MPETVLLVIILMVPSIPDYVLDTRWVLEGVILPAVGCLGVGGE